MNKKIIAPICTAVAMLGLAVGSTFALFTDKGSAEIDVLAGQVKIDYSMTLDVAESRYLDLPPYDAVAAAEGSDFDAIFENGGTAKVLATEDSLNLKLDRLAPMDMIAVTAKATNLSDINIRHRYSIVLDGELVPALQVVVDGTDYSTADTHLEFTSCWSSVATPDVEQLCQKDIRVYFPYGGDEQNFYQGKECDIQVSVEAIQGNAHVEDPEDEDIEIPEYEEIHGQKPSTEEKFTYMFNSNGTVSTKTSGKSVAPETEELILNVENTGTPVVDVPTGKDFLALDVEELGLKTDNDVAVEVGVKIGSGKEGVEVYHDGTLIDSTYDTENGLVNFETKSFSPFDILWNNPKNKSYGFFDSYIVDEGLETEHWVHEISNADEFRNIMDDTIHPLKLGMQQYAGALEEDTVYKLLNDIDFGGSVWSTDEEIAAVNAYPFIGHLVSSNENAGVTLSNVQVTNIYNGVDSGATFCFFSRAVNATFEGINFSNCRIENPGADKAAILVGGNKTTEADYRALELLPNDFEIKYIEFKNLNMDDTCYIMGAESLGSFCSLLRNFRDHILFENCYNEADIVGATNNVGGLLGQTSTNSSIDEIVFYKCVNYGKIVGNASVGGICGAFNNVNISVVDCSNHGEIHYTATNANVGAMGGNVNANAVYENCVNSGFIYTKGTKTNDFGTLRACLDEEGNAVTQDKFNELYVKPNTDPTVIVEIDKPNTKVNVQVTGEAAYYSMVISGTKVDIDVATNKAEPTRSGSIILASFDHLTLAQVQDFALLTQYGFFAPGPGECPIDEYHGSTKIGSRAATVLSTYFLDYSLHGQPGYEGGYGENSKGAYCILDNTGCTSQYYQAFLTFRPNVTYSVNAYDENGNVIASGMAIYSPYVLGGDGNYTTEIVGYIPDVM